MKNDVTKKKGRENENEMRGGGESKVSRGVGESCMRERERCMWWGLNPKCVIIICIE